MITSGESRRIIKRGEDGIVRSLWRIRGPSDVDQIRGGDRVGIKLVGLHKGIHPFPLHPGRTHTVGQERRVGRTRGVGEGELDGILKGELFGESTDEELEDEVRVVVDARDERGGSYGSGWIRPEALELEGGLLGGVGQGEKEGRVLVVFEKGDEGYGGNV